jgi:hypothetical protein
MPHLSFNFLLNYVALLCSLEKLLLFCRKISVLKASNISINFIKKLRLLAVSEMKNQGLKWDYHNCDL